MKIQQRDENKKCASFSKEKKITMTDEFQILNDCYFDSKFKQLPT